MTTGPKRTLDWRSPPPVELSPILAASLDLFHDQGFHGTSVRRIASRVGVTVPALYYHYQNKEAILFAILKLSMDQLVELTEAAAAEPVMHAADRFPNVAQCIIRWQLENRKFSFLDGEARLLSEELRALYVEQRDRVEKCLIDVLDSGVEATSPPTVDLRYTARAILGMIQAIPRWYKQGGEANEDEVAAQYLQLSVVLAGAAN